MSLKFCLLFVLSVFLAFVAAAPQSKIVNGDDAAEGQIPYQAQLFVGGTPTCGATILSEYFALTLSICLCFSGTSNPWPPQVFIVRAGSTDLYLGGVDNRVEEIIVNQDYSELRTGLSVLRMSERFVFSLKIQPIALARQNPPTGAIVDISGFGRLKITDEYPYRTLQYYEQVMMSQAECTSEIGKVDPTVMCLSSPRKFGICTGDFGSPATYNGELVAVGGYILADECATVAPDVFISIAYYYQWILKNIGQ